MTSFTQTLQGHARTVTEARQGLRHGKQFEVDTSHMQHDPVADVLSLLSDSVDTVRALRWRNDHLPELGSPAHTAWINIQIPGRSVAYHAFEAASAQLEAAKDKLLALHIVLEEGDLSVAPYVLARAAIETCGRAYVLLDPGVSEDDHSAIGLADELFELTTLERLCLAQEDDESLHEVLVDIRRRIGKLSRTAKRAAIVVPQRIGVTKAISEVLQSENDDRAGTVAAASYSSFVHAVPRILMAHAWSLDPRMGHEWGVGFSDMAPKHALHLASNALIAYSNAIDRQVIAYGWPPSAWNRWKGRIRAAFRRSVKVFDGCGQREHTVCKTVVMTSSYRRFAGLLGGGRKIIPRRT